MTCRKKIVCLVMAVVSVFALIGCVKPTFAEMEEKAEWITTFPEYGVKNNVLIGNWTTGVDKPFVIVEGEVGVKQISDTRYLIMRIDEYGNYKAFMRVSLTEGGYILFVPNVGRIDPVNPNRISVIQSWGAYYL